VLLSIVSALRVVLHLHILTHLHIFSWIAPHRTKVFKGVPNRKALRTFLAEVQAQQEQVSQLEKETTHSQSLNLEPEGDPYGVPAKLYTTRLDHAVERLQNLSHLLQTVVELPSPASFSPANRVRKSREKPGRTPIRFQNSQPYGSYQMDDLLRSIIVSHVPQFFV